MTPASGWPNTLCRPPEIGSSAGRGRRRAARRGDRVGAGHLRRPGRGRSRRTGSAAAPGRSVAAPARRRRCSRDRPSRSCRSPRLRLQPAARQVEVPALRSGRRSSRAAGRRRSRRPATGRRAPRRPPTIPTVDEPGVRRWFPRCSLPGCEGSAAGTAAQSRVEHVAKGVAQQVEAQHAIMMQTPGTTDGQIDISMNACRWRASTPRTARAAARRARGSPGDASTRIVAEARGELHRDGATELGRMYLKISRALVSPTAGRTPRTARGAPTSPCRVRRGRSSGRTRGSGR